MSSEHLQSAPVLGGERATPARLAQFKNCSPARWQVRWFGRLAWPGMWGLLPPFCLPLQLDGLARNHPEKMEKNERADLY